MTDMRKACSETAKKLGEDPELVYNIAMFQFKFIEEVMKDPNDLHDILIHDLFRFTLKPRFKTDKTKDYSPKL